MKIFYMLTKVWFGSECLRAQLTLFVSNDPVHRLDVLLEILWPCDSKTAVGTYKIFLYKVHSFNVCIQASIFASIRTIRTLFRRWFHMGELGVQWKCTQGCCLVVTYLAHLFLFGMNIPNVPPQAQLVTSFKSAKFTFPILYFVMSRSNMVLESFLSTRYVVALFTSKEVAGSIVSSFQVTLEADFLGCFKSTQFAFIWNIILGRNGM